MNEAGCKCPDCKREEEQIQAMIRANQIEEERRKAEREKMSDVFRRAMEESFRRKAEGYCDRHIQQPFRP